MRLVSDFYRDREALRRLVRKLATAPGARAVDVGCKQGDTSRSLVAAVGSLVAIDLQIHPQWHEPATHLWFAAGDAMALPFPDASFDLAVSSECLQYVPDPALAWREIARVVKPGGRVVVSFPEGNLLTTYLDPDNLLVAVKGLFGRHGGRFVTFPSSRFMIERLPPELELELHLRRGTIAFIYVAAAIDLVEALRLRLARGDALARRCAPALGWLLEPLFRLMNLDTALAPPWLWYNNVLTLRRTAD